MGRSIPIAKAKSIGIHLQIVVPLQVVDFSSGQGRSCLKVVSPLVLGLQTVAFGSGQGRSPLADRRRRLFTSRIGQRRERRPGPKATVCNPKTKKARGCVLPQPRAYKRFPGSVLLSHTASRAVPSALKSLTSVFEMGTGVSSSPLPPEKFLQIFRRTSIRMCVTKYS